MSAPIHFSCPACAKPLRVPASAAGERGPCPACGAEIIGPAGEAPARLVARQPQADEPMAAPDPFAPFPGLGGRSENTVAPSPAIANPAPPADPLPAGPEPFAGFTPPEPEPEETAAPASPPAVVQPPAGGRGRALPRLARGCAGLLGILLAFGGGYFFGRNHQPLPAPWWNSPPVETPESEPAEPEIPAPPEADSPASETPESAAADEPGAAPEARAANPPSLGEPDLPATADPPRPSSRETLVAFLEAVDPEIRRRHVLDPESVDAPMVAAAASGAGGPLDYLEIKPELLDEDLHHYRVKTPDLPNGFPVTLHRAAEGGWAVHWPTFDEFSRDKLAKFAAGKLGESGRFHVFVREESGNSPHFALFRVRAPISGRDYPAFVKRNAPLYSRLTAALDTGARSDTFARVVAERGIPVVLELGYRRNTEDQPYLLIERLIALSWSPES